jgi:hypothetical protein
VTDGIPPPDAVAVAAAAIGKRAVAWASPPFGLSAAERYVVHFDDRSSAFVKAATDARTGDWLRNACQMLRRVGGTLGPRVLAWSDLPRPILVSTDLSGAYWPSGTGRTHWRPGDIAAVLDALGELRRFGPTAGIGPAPDWPGPAWRTLAGSPALIEAGLCSAGWLRRNGQLITELDERAECSTGALVHGDVRSDNLCLLGDGQVRFVDWSTSGTGHPLHDLVLLLPTLRLEGGPDPASVLREPAELIVRLSGPTVRRAVSAPTGPSWLHDVLLRLAVICIRWLSQVLTLEPPDGALTAAP